MSDTTESKTTFTPETQKERWVKYGLNVALAVIVVIALAVVVIAIAQRKNKRLDLTAGKEYSLKPQTLNIIRDLNQPIKLVSLYSKAEKTNDTSTTDYSAAVADLLDEYKRSGRNIDVENIDPVANPSKVDDLVHDVTVKYGGEVARYKDFCESASKYFEPVRAFAKAEEPKLAALPIDPMKNDDANQNFADINNTISGLPGTLDKVAKVVAAQQQSKVPDYKAAADTINSTMQQVSDYADRIATVFQKFQTEPAINADFKAYAISAAPRYVELKKEADAVTADYKKLGELKLDDLRQKLRERDAILVMGQNDMRSLSFDQVWQADTDRKSYQNSADNTVKPKFAGEQQITSAILSLTMTRKPKVVFLRPGGGPLTSPGFPPFQQGGPFSTVAQRLKDYNFDVLEKDMSGQYAMQAQMQGEPAPPEPTDDEIKDAVWIVLVLPMQNQQQQQMPTPSMAPKLAEHLKQGGSALCLFLPQSENMAEVLKPWGIEVRSDLLAVHEAVQSTATSSDMIEEAKKNPVVFVTNQYGDHLITQPLKSLDSVLIPLVPIITTPKSGYTSTAILPVPNVGKIWGEHDIEGALNGSPISFKPEEGDMAPPLFGGSVVQNDKGARLVAIGSVQFITNQMLAIRDPELAQRGIVASRFPGNSELFCNSIFWLAHMEPLIAISPSAMEVSRIGTMSDAALKFWDYGVLLIGLPGAVVVCGMMMYFARRN